MEPEEPRSWKKALRARPVLASATQLMYAMPVAEGAGMAEPVAEAVPVGEVGVLEAETETEPSAERDQRESLPPAPQNSVLLPLQTMEQLPWPMADVLMTLPQ